MDKNINGYQITDHISLEGENYALGHNPQSSAPFAVWKANEDFSQFYFGRYFAHKHAAISDMILRATYQLQRPDGIPLSVDFLAENAREAVELQYIEGKATEAIQEALEYHIGPEGEFGTKLTAEEIMKNPAFLEEAKSEYFSIEHSQENDAMHLAIENILEENPKYLQAGRTKQSLDQTIRNAQTKQTPMLQDPGKEKESVR